MDKTRARAFAALILAVAAPTLPAFGPLGHRVAGEIAAVHLTPEAARAVSELLSGKTLADVSNDPDLWREQRPETGPWHYVNLPPGAERFDAARDVPPEKCAVERIHHFRAVLADPSQDRAARAEALIWLTHLVADLHQPLHVALAADRGGNDIRVFLPGQEEDVNLHRVLDTVLLERQGLDVAAYTRQLMDDIEPADVGAWCRSPVEEWTDESWRLANESAYRDARGPRIRSGDRLGRAWVLTRTAVLEERLQRAGVRLASLLNGALGDPPANAAEDHDGDNSK